MKFEDLQHHTLLWAERRGILANSNASAQLAKLVEEFGEMAAGLVRRNQAQVQDGLGDMLVVMILLAYFQKTDLPTCLAGAYDVIKNRTGRLDSNGIFVKDGDGPSVSFSEGAGHD